jgi:hypothetical protein
MANKQYLFPFGYSRYTDNNNMPTKLPQTVVDKLLSLGIKYIFSGHTPQPTPICIFKSDNSRSDNYVICISVDTSRANGLKGRQKASTALVVYENNINVYANLGKNIASNGIDLEDTHNTGLEVSYGINDDPKLGSFGIFSELVKKCSLLNDHIKNVDDNCQYLITGIYNEKYIIMIRGPKFYMKNILVPKSIY